MFLCPGVGPPGRPAELMCLSKSLKNDLVCVCILKRPYNKQVVKSMYLEEIDTSVYIRTGTRSIVACWGCHTWAAYF